jgi:hypothetical protein
MATRNLAARMRLGSVMGKMSTVGAMASAAALYMAAWTSVAQATEDANACVTAKPESVYKNYGYDHLVHLTNGCKYAVKCSVSSNANPTAQVVTLAVNETTTVRTFQASPAREFTPSVQCEAVK